MMARDPLEVLARLRRLEVEQGRRLLASQREAADAAEARAAAAEAALHAEAGAAAADYAAFLPRALAERERAAAAVRRAQAALEVARAALADRRAQERAVERLTELRAATAREAAAKREQILLDDHAAARE
jgi:flagellar biosynthesis chaperone FliJ